MSERDPIPHAPGAKAMRDHARPYARGSGALLALAPAAMGFAHWAREAPIALEPSWILAATAATAAVLAAAGLTLPHEPRWGRPLGTAGLVGLAALGAAALVRSPLLALFVGSVLVTAIGSLWNAGSSLLERYARRKPLAAGRARGAATATLGLWTVTLVRGTGSMPEELLCVGGAGLVTAALVTVWIVHAQERSRWRLGTLAAALVLAGTRVGVEPSAPASWSNAAIAVAIAALVAVPRHRSTRVAAIDWWEPWLGHPERLFVGTFAALCTIGTLLLALPQSSASGRSIGLLDAAFTAVSAVCVTGLTVRDTGADFSAFGQAILLVLIQLGGLGIMTFSAAALRLLGRRASLRHEGAVARWVGEEDRGRLHASTQRILFTTLGFELTGAALLGTAFLAHGETPARALWLAVFTSISAFCNAGFALDATSLAAYQTSPFALHTVAALIIAGGLSPAVIATAATLARRRGRPVSAQTKISLATSATLLAIGFLGFLAFEWSHTLSGLSVGDRLHNAWFQSATLRTAGFSSVDLDDLAPATLVLMLTWMFVGGCPGGTAGGIKTTTAFVLSLAVTSAIRGRWSLTAFGRHIPAQTVTKATVTATLGLLVFLIATTAMLLTQDVPAGELLFEVVSALGTVGLTLGATEKLDGIGQGIVIACMFLGRLGSLTVLLFLSHRSTPPGIRRPTEEIDVG